MKLLTLCFFAVLLMVACVKDGKDENDVLKGNAQISGRVTFRNIYNGMGEEKVAVNRRVYISYTPTDSVNFIYYVKTDTQGYFTFTRLDDHTDYDLFVEDSVDKVKYAAYLTVHTPNDSVIIIAQNDTIHQNGIVLRVTDNNAQYVSGATISLYNNQQIFLADTAGTQAIASINTDTYGRALFLNYLAGDYYVRGKINYPSGKFVATRTISFGGKGIREFPLVLTTPPAPAKADTLTISTVDNLGGILPNMNFCVFSNPQLFNTQTCDGNVMSASTNTLGIKHITDLPAGTYYVLAQGTIQNIPYKGSATIEWDGISQRVVPVTLNRVTPANTLTVKVEDSTDSPVYNSSLFIYTSKVLFLADTTTTSNGYILNTTTDATGVGNFTNINPGKYYVRAKAIFGNLYLKGGDTVTISPTGAHQSLIKVKR